VLKELYFGGAVVSEAGERQLRGFLDIPFVDYATDRRAARRDGELITDENMIPEFRHGRGI